MDWQAEWTKSQQELSVASRNEHWWITLPKERCAILGRIEYRKQRRLARERVKVADENCRKLLFIQRDKRRVRKMRDWDTEELSLLRKVAEASVKCRQFRKMAWPGRNSTDAAAERTADEVSALEDYQKAMAAVDAFYEERKTLQGTVVS